MNYFFGSTAGVNSFYIVGSSGDCVVENKIRVGSESSAFIAYGTGTPEANLTAPIGSTFHRTDVERERVYMSKNQALEIQVGLQNSRF